MNLRRFSQILEELPSILRRFFVLLPTYDTWFLRFFSGTKNHVTRGLTVPLSGCLPLANQTGSTFISSKNLGIHI